MTCLRLVALLAVLLLGSEVATAQFLRGQAQDGVAFRSDTLRLRIAFPSGVSEVRPEFGDNQSSIDFFREAFDYQLSQDGAFMSGIFIHTVASPDGTTEGNIRLSAERAESVRQFICTEFGLSPFNVHVTSDGENWKEFAEAVAKLSLDECFWRDEALAIIRDTESYDYSGKGVTDRRKTRLQALAGGAAWRYMSANIFPKLRAAYGDALFIISTPVTNDAPETVTETRVIRDTVKVKEIVEVEYNGKLDRKFAKRLEGKRFLLSAKTNVFAIPFINLGVEFPFSNHFSVEFDYYYPFIKRNALHRDCNEMIAYDMGVRYWLPTDKYPEQARLLGHSFGIYGAGGHYDFERNYNGHQGTFFNIGFDWKYAWPVMHGAMHMEIEVGLGMIYSEAQPYQVYDDYGKAFREAGQRRIVRWYGPTRAQFNLVVPFYRKMQPNYRKKSDNTKPGRRSK